MTPEVQANYRTLQLRPNDFTALLLGAGFVTVEVLHRPDGEDGFESRPLLVFTK